MEKYSITISRQFGSLGRTIAQEMSKELGIEFYDRDIVEATAKRMGLPVPEISREEENAGSIFEINPPVYSVVRNIFPANRHNLEQHRDAI